MRKGYKAAAIPRTKQKKHTRKIIIARSAGSAAFAGAALAVLVMAGLIVAL